jgi:hypothetical protein
MKFKNPFKGRGAAADPSQFSVKLSSQPQSGVLLNFMEEAGITHGEEVEANLIGVRINLEEPEDKDKKEQPMLYFCPMDKLVVINKAGTGDGEELPRKVALPEGGLLTSEKLRNGLYNINGVRISSNGQVSIAQTETTTFELVNAE